MNSLFIYRSVTDILDVRLVVRYFAIRGHPVRGFLSEAISKEVNAVARLLVSCRMPVFKFLSFLSGLFFVARLFAIFPPVNS